MDTPGRSCRPPAMGATAAPNTHRLQRARLARATAGAPTGRPQNDMSAASMDHTNPPPSTPHAGVFPRAAPAHPSVRARRCVLAHRSAWAAASRTLAMVAHTHVSPASTVCHTRQRSAHKLPRAGGQRPAGCPHAPPHDHNGVTTGGPLHTPRCWQQPRGAMQLAAAASQLRRDKHTRRGRPLRRTVHMSTWAGGMPPNHHRHTTTTTTAAAAATTCGGGTEMCVSARARVRALASNAAATSPCGHD